MRSKPLPRHPDVPVFSTESLERVVSALGRRAKAIKYQSSKFSCTRELDGGTERLNVDVDLYDFTHVRLSIRASGELWLGVHRKRLGANAGWELAFTGSGEASIIDPTEIVAMLEETLAARSESEKYLAIWSQVRLSSDG